MNLVRFLLIGSLLALSFGELGRYPFGATSGSVLALDLFVGITALFFVIWLVISKISITKTLPLVVKLLLAFWIIATISLLLAGLSLPLVEIAKGATYLVRFVSYSSLMFVAWHIKKAGQSEPIYQSLLIAGGLLFLLGLIQYQYFADFEWLTTYGFDPHKSRLASTILDPNFFGTMLVIFLATVLLYFIEKKKNLWFYLYSSLMIIGVILTYSRSAYLMLVTFLFCLGFFYQRKLLVLLIPAIIVVVVFIPRIQQRVVGALVVDQSASARVESWQNGWTVFQSAPLVGVGFNTYRYVQTEMNLIKSYSSDGGHSGAGVDSSLLLVLATTGIVGLLSYFGWWLVLLKHYFLQKTTKSWIMLSLLISLLLASQFINALFFPSIMVLYFILIGLTYER